MKDIIVKIDSYNKKKANQTQANELSELFGELLRKKIDQTQLVDKLVEFPPPVTKTFITNNYVEITKKGNTFEFLNNFLNTKKIKEPQYPVRIFPIIAIFLQENNQTPAFGRFICSFITRIEHTGAIKKDEGSSSIQFFSNENSGQMTFSNSNFELFKKNILNKEGDLNYRFLQIDYSEVNQGMLKSFTRFLIGLSELKMVDLSHDIALAWADKYEMEFPSLKEKETEQQKDNIAAVENSVENKESKPPKTKKQSTEESSSKNDTEDKQIALSMPEEVSVAAKPEKKQSEKVPTTESKTPQIEDAQEPEVKKEEEVAKKEDTSPIFDTSTMVSELQEAEKSLLATIHQAQESMGQMSTSLTDSLATIDFLKEENKSNEEKITGLKSKQSALEEEKRALEEKIRLTSQKLEESGAEQVALTEKIAQLEEELSQEKKEKSNLLDSETENLRQIDEQTLKITDLEQRLKKSLEQDAIAENQELITLKKELSRKLQEAFGDYQDMAEQEYSSDLLESHKFLLERIFKMFKRHGITLEEEG